MRVQEDINLFIRMSTCMYVIKSAVSSTILNKYLWVCACSCLLIAFVIGIPLHLFLGVIVVANL